MIEETNPLEEAAAAQAQPTSESNAGNIEELLEGNGEIPELIDPEVSEATPASASSTEDETDYEAAS
jgi:hypothetical protein